ncbi:MAG: DUF5119 domain-containing protein [Muribaculaceae bacterium]|nr:DUF5119 domain-containing protein [Muribaculaceae bacterium]
MTPLPNRYTTCSNLRHTRQTSLRTATLSLSLCASVYLVTGCEHKDLIYPLDTCKVKISFDWSKASNAQPEGMTVMCYPCNSDTRTWRFDIAGRNGGYIELPAGKYKVLTVNNDLPGLRFINTDYINTFEAVSVKLDSEDMMPTGMLYGTTIGTDHDPILSIPAFSGSWNSSQPEYNLTLTPDSLCTILHLDVLNLHNGRQIRSVSACLSGTPYSLLIQSDIPEDATMHTGFSLEPIIPDSSINLHGHTSMLGTPMPHIMYELVIKAVMKNGVTYKKNFDVTQQLLNSPWPRNIFVTIDNVELSDENESTGSFELGADVDGWNKVLIEITTDQ